ncbi:RING/U-box superfamily protein [Rhynchospora pubera]|uniref:RING-type E3 ubiquitin transferase n=1 Tax=Rhynchospora pubera TaxID=906938 RepID=A0AAV8HWU7_9POAL|nr:RING/U-box superfamily protein [Rhynchospora pubera]
MAVPALAQSPPPPSYPGYTTSSFSLTMALVLAFLVLVFVAISIVSVCVNRYSFNGTDQQPVFPTPREPRMSVGLDQSLVDMFPVIDYEGVKGIKIGNGPLECAVCLSEFDDSDKIRLLLPGCCHAFHPECIDDWLKNHVTCPVCRSDLTHNAEIIAGENNLTSENGEHHLAIAAVDRFTLRLPEHVQRDIEASRGEQRLAARIGGHRYEVLPASRSGKVWSFLRVFSSRRPPGEFGEGSIRREGSVRRDGSVRRNGSIRRDGSIRKDGSVRRVASIGNFRTSSLRSGSLRLSPSNEVAEASDGSVGRLSPITAPRIPNPRGKAGSTLLLSPGNGGESDGRTSPVTITGMAGLRSGSIKLIPGSVANGRSAPSSPSQGGNPASPIKSSPGIVINGRSAPSPPLQVKGGNQEADRDAIDLMTLDRV